MASLEFIQKRIAGKEKEIEKLTKKLDRIRKAEATGWEVNPYYYHESDLKYTLRDLEAAKKALDEYKAKLEQETEKANSRNVKAIWDFLEAWKQHMRDFYRDSIPGYVAATKEFYEADRKLTERSNSLWSLYKDDREKYKEEKRKLRKEESDLRSAYHERWGYMDRYCDSRGRFDWDLFERDIKAEAIRKYDNIIERTNAICGTITDASGLEVGYSGELDGYVIGEKGTAHVHTIGAGGYKIQCYHFRVLVHEIKRS